MLDKDLLLILGNNIRKYRKSMDFSQNTFAEKINCSVQTVSKIENGKCWPRHEILEKIIDVLNVKPSFLFIESDVEYKLIQEEIILTVSKILDESFSSFQKREEKKY